MDPAPEVSTPPGTFYVMQKGKIIGPFSLDELRTGLDSGRWSAKDLAQAEGLPIWRPLGLLLGDQNPVRADVAPGGPPPLPNWEMIFSWAGYRLWAGTGRDGVKLGVGALVVGAITILLSGWPFVPSLPWFAIALASGYVLLRGGRSTVGIVLMAVAVAAPLVLQTLAPTRGYSGIAAAEPLVTAPSSRPVVHVPAPSPILEIAPRRREEPPASADAPPPSLPPAMVVETVRPEPVVAPEVASASAPTAHLVSAESAPAIMANVPPPLPPPLLPIPKSSAESPVPASIPALNQPQPESQGLAGGELVQRHREAFIVIKSKEGAGSGFICRRGNSVWLLTNNHVVAGMRNPQFTRIDGARVTVDTPESAAGYDLMRFGIKEPAIRPLEMAESIENIAKIGDEVVVLGNSGGGGVVTSLSGKLVGVGPDRIEVNAEFIPGNSGSPIVHVPSGKVIGIATYLTRKYDEFSLDPKAPGVITRRFGFRIDNVLKWESVNWIVFQAEADSMRNISALTGDIFDFFNAVRSDGRPTFATETLRRPAGEWVAAMERPRTSDADRFAATQRFLSVLRSMVRSDVAAAEGRLRYTFFRDQLKDEREVRDRLFKAFDDQIRVLSSPTSRFNGPRPQRR